MTTCKAMHWDKKWMGGLIILLGVYLLLNTMILSEPPRRIVIHDILVSLTFFVCGMAYGRGKGHFTLPWVFFTLGCYLQVAPVLLAAPQAVQFLNHTVVGILIATVGGLVPFARADALHAAPSRPQNWSYNPSAWSQRLLVFIFCICCFAAASYLAAYQMGYIHYMWDPVFGDEGTLQVITSSLSRSFPVSDAGLGAALYAIEALCVWKGGAARWYTSPAFVLFFGVLVIPVGAVSILLIISQPLIVGHWCFWCLLTAMCMLFMIALAVDEVFATLQFLAQTRQTNPHDFWRTFWHGGKPVLGEAVLGKPVVGEAAHDSEGLNKELELDENATWAGLTRAGLTWAELTRGVSINIPLVLSICVGGWLMISSTMQEVSDSIAHLKDCIGPLVIAVSVISMAEVMRPMRYVNIFFGLILCCALFLTETYHYEKAEALLAGLLLIFLSFPKAKVRS